jgi:hypothetical protein
VYVGIVGVGMEENVSATDTMDNLYKFKGESLGRSSFDEGWYDNKLKKEEHEENVDNNDNKQDAEPPPGLLQITNLWWARMC